MKNNLFLYWENKQGVKPPPYINLCKQTFIKHCSKDFEINFIDSSSNLVLEMPPKWHLVPKLCQKVDILRVFLLEKYGGLWFDIDTIMIKSPIEILRPIIEHGYDFTYFKFSKLSPGVALNGFFGAKKNSQILNLYKNQIIKSLEKSEYEHTEFGELALNAILNTVLKQRKNIKTKVLPLNWVYQLENNEDFRLPGNKGMHFELLRKNLSVKDVVKDYTIGVSLYNDMYNTNSEVKKEFDVVNMTEEEFLSSDVLAAKIIKESLKQI